MSHRPAIMFVHPTSAGTAPMTSTTAITAHFFALLGRLTRRSTPPTGLPHAGLATLNRARPTTQHPSVPAYKRRAHPGGAWPFTAAGSDDRL